MNSKLKSFVDNAAAAAKIVFKPSFWLMNHPYNKLWNVTLINKDGRTNNRAQKGKIAGTRTGGRVEVRIDSINYKASRVIWEMHEYRLGEDELIDHIDRNFMNNNLSNLRVVDHRTNMHNTSKHSRNSSGVTGVCFDKVFQNNRYYSYWRANWCNFDRKLCRKSFSVEKYGNDEAFRLACECRTKMIEDLNSQGAGYTERHGK